MDHYIRRRLWLRLRPKRGGVEKNCSSNAQYCVLSDGSVYFVFSRQFSYLTVRGRSLPICGAASGKEGGSGSTILCEKKSGVIKVCFTSVLLTRSDTDPLKN